MLTTTIIQQLAASLASSSVVADVNLALSKPASLLRPLAEDTQTPFPAANGIAFHTNQVRLGDAFFALPGEQVHGIRFADKALELGAAFIVSDQPHPKGVQVDDPAAVLLALGYAARAERQGRVIGVTGSAGKTTTKTLAAAALACDKSQGNFNTPLALAKTLVDNLLRGDGDKPLVLELGIDHLGEMDGLVALAKPDIGILTLIAESHLKGLGTLENVATEKKKLINASPRKLVSAEAWHFLTPAEQAGAWCYGLEAQDADKPLPETTVLASVSVSQKDASQVLTVLGENLSLSTLGTAAARSATAAMALAKMLDDDLSQAAANISTAKFEGRRLEVHQLAGLTFIDDAYNSNPASMRQALEVLAHYPKPHTLVVGDMLELADRSETLHRELGKATKHLDRVIAVGPEASYIAAENPQATYLPTLESLLAQLDSLNLPTTGTLLVKASLGMKLAQFVQAFKDYASLRYNGTPHSDATDAQTRTRQITPTAQPQQSTAQFTNTAQVEAIRS